MSWPASSFARLVVLVTVEIGRTESESGIDQCVDIGSEGAVIDEGGANRQTAIDGGCGRRGNARFLQIGNDVLIELVRVFGAVPEANDVERNRRQQLQCRLTLNALLHVFRQRAGAGDHVAELPGSIGFDGEPRLEGSETTGKVRSEIARPRRAGGQPASVPL